MNLPENDVVRRIKSLIDYGATIEIFQEFIGPEQTFKTVLVYKGNKTKILYDRPMPFIIQAGGQIIENSEIPKPPSRYHPS